MLEAFRDADNLGSLITPPVFDAGKLLGQVEALERNNPLFGADAGVLRGVVEQAELLRRQYWVVVANPPYLTRNSFPQKLTNFIDDKYKNGNLNLFSAFMMLNLRQTYQAGAVATINQLAWMFLDNYESLALPTAW